MAIEIKNTNYSGEVLEQILTLASTGNEIVEKGLIHVIPNVSKKISVPRMTTGKVLQQRKEQPKLTDSKGKFTYTEKTLEPQDFMAFTTFNPRTFESIWRKWQPKGNLVFAELPPEGQNLLLAELAKQVKFELGYHYINGKKGTTDDELFNGILVRMESDPDTVKAGSSAMSMIGRLYMLRKHIPETMRNNPGLRILMSVSDFDQYDSELTAQANKGVNHTDVSAERFKGIKIEKLVNWPSGKMTATICGMDTNSNLFAAVNLQDDEDVVKIGLYENAGELYFFKLLMKVDTNIAFGQECIMYERAAPAISGDTTSLDFPVGGDEKMVKITSTEEYIVDDETLPDGVSYFITDEGILFSADDNTGGADDIATDIIVRLKEHRSKRLKISITQPKA